MCKPRRIDLKPNRFKTEPLERVHDSARRLFTTTRNRPSSVRRPSVVRRPLSRRPGQTGTVKRTEKRTTTRTGTRRAFSIATLFSLLVVVHDPSISTSITQSRSDRIDLGSISTARPSIVDRPRQREPRIEVCVNFKRRNHVWLITRVVYALNMLGVRVYYMNNSLVVVPSGRVTRSFVFVFVFVHTMTTALDDDDGTRRRRRDGGQLGEVRVGTSRRTRTRKSGNGTEVETGRVNASSSVIRHHRSWVQRLCRRGVID